VYCKNKNHAKKSRNWSIFGSKFIKIYELFEVNWLFKDCLNKGEVFFAVEIFLKKHAVQKTGCFTYRTTPELNYVLKDQ